jgi:hypothetical protein
MVAGPLHRHLNSPAVLIEQEVMDCALLIEAHRLGTAGKHLLIMRVVVVRLASRRLLRPSRGRAPHGERGDDGHSAKSTCHTSCLQAVAVEQFFIHSQPWNGSNLKAP